MIIKHIGMIAVDRQKKKKIIFKFGQVRQGVRVLSFHYFGNLGGQLKTRYDDALARKEKAIYTINA